MSALWNQVLKGAKSVDRDIIIETLKIILNHYIPNAK
jgi:hypothetical protein